MTALELFPCSGGMAEGFRRAGITFEWAFDVAPDHCDSYETNLGHRPVCMDVRDLLRMVRGGWAPTTQLDLVVADPPCTPWSRAGKRKGVEDPRDMLGATCELIRLLRPRAYLIGNVPGLDDSTQWHHVQRALAPLRKADYCIADYTSLDAADFGVPQHRIRPFWFGHLEGPCISWPLPTHSAPSRNACLAGTELRPWVTCRNALEHLPLELLGRPVRIKPVARESQRPICTPDAPAPVQTADGGRPGKRAGVLRALDPNRPPAASHAPVRTISRAREQATIRWPWDRPSTTIDSTDVLAPYGRDGRAGEHQRSHPNAVVLSELAATILQGFPEDWCFSGNTKTVRWSQLGQAMPPPLAHAVATSVARQLQQMQSTGRVA